MAVSLLSALALLGGVVGAGFASGQEIVHFFARHGGGAWASAALAVTVLSLLVLRLPVLMERTRCASLPALCLVRFGRRLGALTGVLFFLLCAVTGGAMLAACAELFALSLNIRRAYALGMICSLLLGFFCACAGISGLALPGALVCALLPMLLLALLRLPAGEADFLPQASPLLSAFDGVLYGSLNAAMLAGMLPLLLPLDRRARRRCVCVFSLLLCALLALGTLACRRHLSAVRDQSLPFVWLSRALGRGGYLLVAACLYASALSTFCAMLSGMTPALPSSRLRSSAWRTALCAGCCLLFAQLGFSRIVRSAYPVLGLLCAALLLLLCLPFGGMRASSKEAGR